MILLVEDDAVLRMDFAQKLRAHGYEVVEARDGTEAIGFLYSHRTEIELVITDMALPNLNGLKLVETIQTLWPQVPVIMVSGYLSKESADAILGPQVGVLEKPVRPSVLIGLVQRILPQPQHS